MLNWCVTGGSGFIGRHLIKYLLKNNLAKKIYNLDLIEYNFKDNRVIYHYCDIRKKINETINDIDILIHLAALAKEPGYKWNEYFETNYYGTKNVINFAERAKIKFIIFTSTIMVYGPSEISLKEDDLKFPDTAYGISKLLAEETLMNWKACRTDRKLKIIRPGIVFGKDENANMTRLFNSIKNFYFFYPGRKDTIKGIIYIKDLINFIHFCLSDNTDNVVYNLVIPNQVTIKDIVDTICKLFNLRRIIPVFPFRLLHLVSYFFEFLNYLGLKNTIHHRRVEKLYLSSNISSDLAIKSGFSFEYNLLEAFKDWKKECNENNLC